MIPRRYIGDLFARYGRMKKRALLVCVLFAILCYVPEELLLTRACGKITCPYR